MSNDIPTYRELIGNEFVYRTSADEPLTGSFVQMPLRGTEDEPSPAQVPGLAFWYRADFGVSLDGSNRVSEWKDVSGNRLHVVQPDSLSRPYFSASNPIFNDYPTVNFPAGVSTFLSCAYSPLFGDVEQITIFAAVNLLPGWTTYSTIISNPTTGGWNNGWSVGARNLSTSCGFWFNGWGNYIEKPYTFPAKVIITARTTGSSIQYRSNRTLTNTVSKGAASKSAAPMLIGAAAGGYRGRFSAAEIFAYNRDMTDDEITKMENYLITKYGQGDQ